jgi:DoxX-like family
MTTSTKHKLYWGATGLIAVAFTMGGVVDSLRLPEALKIMSHLGYPAYFASIIGAWKLLAVATVLVPRYALLKEWAYAGLFRDCLAHRGRGGLSDVLPPVTVLALVVASWALRPTSRRLTASPSSS